MNQSSSQNAWTPFKIPPAPNAQDVGDYSLHLTPNAAPDTNPSKFLRWKKSTGLPDGSQLGDILYWDPEAGGEDEEGEPTGDWVILPPPEGGELHGLVIEGDAPFWVEAKTFTVCENGVSKEYKIPAQEVE